MQNNDYEQFIAGLNGINTDLRLQSLRNLMEAIEDGFLPRPVNNGDINNHIHTSYSFSPYSPAKAVWMAYNAGLATAGIVDHDTISGAKEFIEAGKITGTATTIGIECRADFSATPLAGKRINNPDQRSVGYITLQAVPHKKIDAVKEFFKPYSDLRNIRNERMTEKLNLMLQAYGIQLDYHDEVVPLSMCHDGGSVTERHILYALSLKLISMLGKGFKLVKFATDELKMTLSPRIEGYLMDEDNPFYAYDLLGALKSRLTFLFYIDATGECPFVSDVVAFSDKIGAVSAYAYLGDIEESITGDKKAQKFEDEYIGLLFEVIGKLGFKAVTYMPSRNTAAQLDRVRKLCKEYKFLQVSGEDINSPRQSFICPAMKNPEFCNLVDSTWALIGHEKAATTDLKLGMYSKKTIAQHPDLNERISHFKAIGKGC